VRRTLQIAAGLGLSWLALQATARASEPPSPPVAAIGPAFDDDAAMPAHADPVASYTLHASLDPVKHVVEGKGTITWRNASTVAQREVYLHLYLNAFKNEHTVFMRFPGAASFRGSGAPDAWGSVTVKRFALHDGADLWPGADKTSPGDPEDETDIRVPLPEAVEPGATARFDVEFESHLPSALLRTGFSGSFHMVAQWFPKLARLEPDGRWAHFTFHHLSEFYADFGSYDVTVDTPGSFVVGATGQLAGEVREGDRVARRFVQEDVHDFAFAAWDQFHELTATSAEGVAVRVLFPPRYDRAARVELDSVLFGLAHLGGAFGRYPYRTLTVVHPPAGAEEAGGMEYPTLITTGGSWYYPWTGVRAIDIVTVHELGHQWFYGLVASDEHAWPFLDEGINSYAESDAMEARFPGSSAIDGLGLTVSIAAANRIGASEAERNAPVAQPATDFFTGSDYAALVYQRTATLLDTLANVYGKDRVRRAVGRYARRYRFQHPGPEALLEAMREVAGDDAAEALRAGLFDRATVDYSVSEVSPATEGEGYPSNVLVRRRGALRFPVDVDLIGEDGTAERVRWDAAESAARLPYSGKSKLVAAVIDPEHRVLVDDDLGDNARSASPSRLSGGLLDRFAFAAEAALSGLLP
jgi:Peptidase family M1 domain